MASAGRILIMPKGNYDSGVTYEMLDLVFNGGASWVAKKTVVGIEPNEENTEHWMKMCDSVDLTEVNRRLTELENRAVVDLTPYALKTEVAAVSGEVDALEELVAGLTQTVSGLSLSIAEVEENQPSSKCGIVTYKGTNVIPTAENPVSVTFDFVPKVIIMLGTVSMSYISGGGVLYQQSDISYGNDQYKHSVIYCDAISTEYTKDAGFVLWNEYNQPVRYAKKSADGKTISWYSNASTAYAQYNTGNTTYYVLGIG